MWSLAWPFLAILAVGALLVLINDLIEWATAPIGQEPPARTDPILRRSLAEREQAALENFEAMSRGGDWQEQTAALKTRELLHRRNTR